MLGRFLWLPFSIHSALLGSLFLWLGYRIRVRELLNKVQWQHYICAQLIFLFGVFFHYSNISFVEAFMTDILISLIVGLAGCLLVYLISRKLEKVSILQYVGKISLTILCVHLYTWEGITDIYSLANQIGGNALNAVIIQIIYGITVAVLGACIFEVLNHRVFKKYASFVAKKRTKLCENMKENPTPRSLYVLKGLLIFLFLISHLPVSFGLRNMINSVSLTGLIFTEGYEWKNKTKTQPLIYLFTYAFSFLIYLVLNLQRFSMSFLTQTITQFSLGLSSTNLLFSNVLSVGYLSFLLILSGVYYLNYFVDILLRNHNQYKPLIVITLSVIGMLFGTIGDWLPWSMDLILSTYVIYYLGILFAKYSLIDSYKQYGFFYFPLSCIWAYFLYTNQADLMNRLYFMYGGFILGAISGISLLLILCDYLERATICISSLLHRLGESYVFSIVAYSLFGGLAQVIAIQV